MVKSFLKKGKRQIGMALLASAVLIGGTTTVAQAASTPTAQFSFTVKTSSTKGTPSSSSAVKATSADYAIFNISSLSNSSYGVWMRAGLGSYSNYSVASSEQKFTTSTQKKSYYLSGKKKQGSSYIAVGRLVPGSPKVTVKGYMTP